MNRKIASGTMLTLLFIGTLTLTFRVQPVKSEPTTWTVDDDGPADFHMIQEAINTASSGDTIYVFSGTYYELVKIHPSILLIGEDKHKTIIDGLQRLGSVVAIYGKNVSISGFTIRNSHIYTCAGIKIYKSSYAKINDNIIMDNLGPGVFIYESHHNIISNNIITNNQNNGIFIYAPSDNAGWNIIKANSITSNTLSGIHLTDSHRNILEANVISNQRSGGIFFLQATNNTIKHNLIANNQRGIALWGYHTSGNSFFHNNFIINTHQVHGEYYGSNSWDDRYPSGGNYWSDQYHGECADHFSGPGQDIPGSDGIVDTPYVIDENNQDRYPLMNPWIPPGLFADLIQRKAWPEHHHYDISKDEDEDQTLCAKVKNLGNETVWAKALFNITKEDGSSAIIESELMLIETEATVDLSANFGPLTDEDIGKYSVSATCSYSHTKIVWAQGKKTKAFKFNIVP